MEIHRLKVHPEVLRGLFVIRIGKMETARGHRPGKKPRYHPVKKAEEEAYKGKKHPLGYLAKF
jgi:hypothetical protein